MNSNSMEAMTALDIAKAIEQGTLTCEAVAEACLARIAAREPQVHAWTIVDREQTLARARRLDRTAQHGPLRGVPIGIKDIIATAELPTAYGSPIYAGHRAVADAACVALLSGAGAIIPGKTVTTEFAYFHPGPTTHPRNPAHTPGGSSSGSAAAVADGMVPLALGTQTGGSVIRPAAFCGIVGYKPTFNRLNMSGVRMLSPSLDTLGCMARTVDDVELLRTTLTGEPYRALERPSRPRVGIYRGVEWSLADPSAQRAVTDVAQALRTIADVDEVEVVDDRAGDTHTTIMAFEMAQSLTFEYARHGDALSAALRELIERGMRTSYREYVAAQAAARAARIAALAWFDARDLLLTPSAPGEAPVGLERTGDPVFNRRWTLLGLPAVTLPTHTGPAGLPIGVQLIGTQDGDRALLALAKLVHSSVR